MPNNTSLAAKVLLIFGLAALASAPLAAAVQLPALISDHMVLQRGVPIHIWGKAEPGEDVKVAFRGDSAAARAAADGKWQVYLKPVEAGGPYEMKIEGRNAITVNDILVGEVWVGSGQSNMEWPVERAVSAGQEIAAADYPEIRIFTVARKVAEQPVEDVEGSWQLCSPATIGSFSAVEYFFARHLHKALRVPFGAIESSWGGTPAEAWTPRPRLDTDPALRPLLGEWSNVLSDYAPAKSRYDRELADWQKLAERNKGSERALPPRPREPRGPGHPHTPAGLYNGMIAPLAPFAIRGVIWYQGESNANRNHGYLYRHLFKAMILEWRSAWDIGPFPFLFVQLANYARTGENSEWPEVREAQHLALDLRNTGEAVTIDIGESRDIHPKNKQDVGLRLALAAEKIAYGRDVVYSGPDYRQISIEGKDVRVWFDHAEQGLKTSDGLEPKGFAIAGSDHRFVPAQARIDGYTVVVSSPQVANPLAVRYAWGDDPAATLYNTADLPASPFRSDQWKDAAMPE